MMNQLRMYLRRYTGVTVVVGGTLGFAMIPEIVDKMMMKSEEYLTDETSD